MKEQTKNKFTFERLSDRYILLILAGLGVVSRLPFVGTFQVVAYDGTYYLNQARSVFSGHMAGSFPIGYPLFVRLFQAALRDYQLAGMTVSFVAGVSAACVAYLLAKHFVRRELAFLAAVTLALNPLLIRLSLMTLSESLYIFLVLFGLLLYVEKRWVPFGLTMGLAAITRPEAIAIVGLLGLTQIRKPKQLAVIAASFLVVYALNSVVLSVNAGRPVILPKSEFIGSSTAFWKLREASIEFQGKEDAFGQLEAEGKRKLAGAAYLERLPTEFLLVVKHVWPVILLLALYSLRRRKYWFLAAALVSFFVIPLTTVRSMDRYILPYIPILIILAVLAVGDLRNKSLRAAAVGLIAVTIIALPVFQKSALLEPEERGLVPIKRAGLQFRDQVDPDDKIAGRKPFFAFYSGGKYVEIPVAPYDDVMKHIAEVEKVKFLALHQHTIHLLRPALRPLMYSKATINGELRFRQVYFDPEGVMVFQRVREDDPLRWNRVTPPGGTDFAPAWSPDGKRIAFRSKTGEGTGGIYVIEFGGELPRKVAEAAPLYDQLSWSPDGERIAFSDGEPDGADVYSVEIGSGRVERIVSGTGIDMSPSWSPTGEEILFSSNRSGRSEIWAVRLSNDTLRRITSDGDNTHPAVSPSGEYVAWIKQDRGVVVMHGPSDRMSMFQAPRLVRYAPAWSPDERYLAVTAEDWGSWDVYLMKADGTNALLLTKNPKRDAMPAWSPDGERILLISDVGQKSLSIWTVEGLRPYLGGLETRPTMSVLDANDLRQ